VTQPKKPSPRDPSAAYKRMEPKWALADTLLGGTDAMRAAGKAYLPQHENESNVNYNNRLSRAVLDNVFEDVLDSLTGRPFKTPMTVDDKVPQALQDMLDDVDLQGHDLHSFCRDWFRMGWAKGLAHVLVDHQIGREVFDNEGKARARTLDDDRQEGLRPYLALIRPENVLAAYSTVVNGQEELTHVRILEASVEKVGEWEEACVERVKVFEKYEGGPVQWTVYKEDTQKKEWVAEDGGTIGLPYIPLRTFYAGKRLGLHECKPPLHDLAHLNTAHWQSSSDQRNVLTVARFPILAASGYTPETTTTPDGQTVTNVKVGPNNFLTTEDAQGKWYYVEHTGAAIEAGRNDLKDLEQRMASYGAEMLTAKPGGETATGRALDTAEATSHLEATVQDFKDLVETVLQDMATWANIEGDAGTVSFKGEFTVSETAQGELDFLSKMRDRKDISRIALIDEAKRRKILKEDYDPEEDKDLIDEEAADGMGGDMFGGGNGTGPNGGMPGVPGGGKMPPNDTVPGGGSGE
jgi:hypothetical protein